MRIKRYFSTFDDLLAGSAKIRFMRLTTLALPRGMPEHLHGRMAMTMTKREASRTGSLALTVRDAKIDANKRRPAVPLIDALEAIYLCPIMAYLAQMQQTPMTPHERFFIVWAKGREEYFVQCLFFDNDKQIRCERASGYYDAAIKGFATAAKRQALAELGFSTDASVGNFAQERPVDLGSTSEIARLIIATLAGVYDLKIGDTLEYYAPLLSEEKSSPIVGGQMTSALQRELALALSELALGLSTYLARHLLRFLRRGE
jgi:hypothetical protein